MTKREFRPYFLWDEDVSLGKLQQVLAGPDSRRRDELLGKMLREARDIDVWQFVRPAEVAGALERLWRSWGRRVLELPPRRLASPWSPRHLASSPRSSARYWQRRNRAERRRGWRCCAAGHAAARRRPRCAMPRGPGQTAGSSRGSGVGDPRQSGVPAVRMVGFR